MFLNGYTYFIWNNETFLETHRKPSIPAILKHTNIIDIKTKISTILFIHMYYIYNISLYPAVFLTEFKNPNDSNSFNN